MKCDEAFDKVRMNDDYSVSVSKKKIVWKTVEMTATCFYMYARFLLKLIKTLLKCVTCSGGQLDLQFSSYTTFSKWMRVMFVDLVQGS